MISSVLELLLTFGLGIIVSGLAFLLFRRSLTVDEEIVLPKEDYRVKVKVPKQQVKIKLVKKDSSSNKPKNNLKTEKSNSNSVKSHETLQVITESITAAAVERNRNDSTTEWTKVIKPTKKPKKETKSEMENFSANDDVIKTLTKENNEKESVKPKIAEKETTNNKSKIESSLKSEPVKEIKSEKVIEKPSEQGKNAKLKKFVTINEDVVNKETKIKSQMDESKSKVVDHENEEVKNKLNEMMMELDKIKNNQKEDSKASNNVNKEFESLKLKLKSSQANEEKLLEDVRKKGQAVTDLKNQFLIIQSELTKNIVSNQTITREKSSLESRVRTLEEQNTKMNEKCQLNEQLKVENESLRKNFKAVEQELNKVKVEYSEIMKSKELELLAQINLLQVDKQRMQDQLVRVQTDLIDNNNKMQAIQHDLLTAKSTHADLLNENLRLQKQYADLEQSILLKQHELADFDNKMKQNEEQITCLKKQINDLNTVNINLSVQKSDLEKQVEQLCNSQSTINTSEIAELSEKINLLNQQISQYKSELSASQTKIEEFNNTSDQFAIQSKELTAERDNLLALVDQYKSGLESTESILSKLQTSVNEEENKWRESLIKSETEAEKSKKELEIVYNDLMRIRNSRAEKNELNFAYHCVDKSLSSLIDEMEARMIHFEKSLETVVQERDVALSQISSQVNGAANTHEIVNGDHLSVHNDDSEIEKLKIELDNQIEANKSLEIHCNKYKSLIDVGKDALEVEKIRVQELQEELKSLQSLSSNISSANVEISLDAK